MRNGRSATFAAALLLLPPAAALSAPPRGGTRYSGETSEGLAVHLRVSDSGDYVAHMRIRFRVSCTDGTRGAPTTDLFDLRIDDHGRFHFRGTYIGHVDKSRNHVRMHGTISRRRASGSFRLTATRKKARCHSDLVRWHARVAS